MTVRSVVSAVRRRSGDLGESPFPALTRTDAMTPSISRAAVGCNTANVSSRTLLLGGAKGRRKAVAMSWTRDARRRSATLSRPPFGRLVPAIAASKSLCSSHASKIHRGSTVQPNSRVPLIPGATPSR